jgi:CcmD family protein
MSDTAWLFVAFAAVWVAIGGYLLSITARQRRLEQRIDDVSTRSGP